MGILERSDTGAVAKIKMNAPDRLNALSDEMLAALSTAPAGDVVLFSEGTVHGALPWTCQERQRRACLYRFAPATMSYGRSYFGHEGGGWPKAMYEGLTEAERAVLEAPYANRLDRPNIKEDGSVATIMCRRFKTW